MAQPTLEQLNDAIAKASANKDAPYVKMYTDMRDKLYPPDNSSMLEKTGTFAKDKLSALVRGTYQSIEALPGVPGSFLKFSDPKGVGIPGLPTMEESSKFFGQADSLPPPKDKLEEYLQTAGNMVIGAGGAGSIPTQLLKTVVAPALVSETAGQLTKGTAAEPWARVGGAAVGGGIPALLSAVRNPDKLLANATKGGNLSDLSPEAMLMESSHKATGLAQALATAPGPARDAIQEALIQRRQGQVPRLQNEATTQLGPLPSANLTMQAMKDQAHAAAEPAYKAAYTKAPDFTKLYSTAKQAINMVKSKLLPSEQGALSTINTDLKKAMGQTETTIKPDGTKITTKPLSAEQQGEALHKLRIQLDSRIATGDAYNSLSPNEKLAQGALRGVRNIVDNLLKTHVPGFEAADLAHSTAMEKIDSIGFGKKVLGGGAEAITPEELAAKLAAPKPKLHPDEVRTGVKSDIRTAMGTQSNDLAALSKKIGGLFDFNRDKMTQLFGPDVTNALIKRIESERRFAQTQQDVIGGSQTASRQAGQDMLKPGVDLPFGTTLTGIGSKAVTSLYNKLASSTMSNANKLYLASKLVSQGPEAAAILAKKPESILAEILKQAAKSGAVSSVRGHQ